MTKKLKQFISEAIIPAKKPSAILSSHGFKKHGDTIRDGDGIDNSEHHPTKPVPHSDLHTDLIKHGYDHEDAGDGVHSYHKDNETKSTRSFHELAVHVKDGNVHKVHQMYGRPLGKDSYD